MNKNVENIIEDNMMNYAAYVLLDRCLPDLRDGLKPVHRRIIYGMHLEKAYKFTKSASISGAVMKLHPHGSAYGTMVNMVQKDKQIVPYLEGKGNFAQHTSRDLQAGAERYTEVKLSEFTSDILKDINNNLVDFVPNYDGTIQIPEVLPTFYPTILAYSNSGIGVGNSSSIGSFNIKELCKAIMKYLETNEETLLIPDFPTGGYIINNEEVFKKINETGIGTIRLRSNYKINKNVIEITEIPYSTTREAIIDKIIELVKNGKLKEIVDIRDLTGLKGQLIEIICKKNIDMELLIEKLYRLTPLESTFSYNMNMLVNNLPKTVGVWETIREWLIWRKSCIKRKLETEIIKVEKELHLLSGFEKIISDIDKVINIIRFEDETVISTVLMREFELDEIQANEISNMKLRNINKNYIERKLVKIQELKTSIEEKKNLIATGIEKIIYDDMKYTIKTYGVERKTKLIDVCEEIKQKIKEAEVKIEEYPVKIVITKHGYVHKYKNMNIDLDSLKIKEGDEIVNVFETCNTAELLIFAETDCYKILINEIEDTAKNSFGTFIKSLVKVEDIISIGVLDENLKYILVWYANNKLAKVEGTSFFTKANRRRLNNSLNKNAEVKKMWFLKDDCDFEVRTAKKSYKKNTAQITAKGSRATQGNNVVGNKEILDIII